MRPPSTELLDALRAGLGDRALPELEALADKLANLVERAAAAWPALDVAPHRFARYLGERLPRTAPVEDALDAAFAPDLFLACACVDGVPGAAETFTRLHLSSLPAMLARLKPTPSFLDEVHQILAEKLLVRAARGGPPRLAAYAGTGALGPWVRVAATRVAVDLLRQRALLPLDDTSRGGGDLAPGHAALLDPELQHLKRRHARDFEAALADTVAALPPDQRALLRLNFVEGLNIDAIGARLHVHRATVARRIAAARKAILDRTRARLQERLALTPAECDSLVAFVRSRIEISLTGLLRTAPSTDDDEESSPAK